MRITIYTDGEQGYHLLWTVDIYHGDPSLGNMAMRRDKDGHFYGVLTDWDLANIGQLKECRSDWRTGTTPFMALDVLNEDFETENLTRVYRHELEGHIWVIPWVIFQYQQGQYNPHSLLDNWRIKGIDKVHSGKRNFRDQSKGPVPTPKYGPLEEWEDQWSLMGRMMFTLHAPCTCIYCTIALAVLSYFWGSCVS